MKSAFRTGPAVTGCGMAGRSPGNSGGAAAIQPSSQPALRKDFIFVRLHLAAARGTGEEAIPSPRAAPVPCARPNDRILACFHFLISFSPLQTAHLTQWRLPIRSRRGCHATYLGGRLAQPAFTGAMPKRKPPVPLRARGALRAGSERAALPPRRRRRRRGCSALRPAAGSVHCSSAGPRPESRGSGSQRGHPAPAPLNTAGQVRLFLIPSSSHKSTVCGRRAPAAARPAPESPPIALPSRSLSFSLVSSSPRGGNSTAGLLVLHFTARETLPPERLKQSGEQSLSTLLPSLPAPSNAAG